MKGICDQTVTYTCTFIQYTGNNAEEVFDFLKEYDKDLFASYDIDTDYESMVLLYGSKAPVSDPTARVTLGTIVLRNLTMGTLDFLTEAEFLKQYHDIEVGA